MILVAQDGRPEVVQRLRSHRCLVGDRVRELVRRDLVPHHDAVTIGLLEEPRMQRVVGTGHRRAEPHQRLPDALAHLRRQRRADRDVLLVEARAAQRHRLAVDQQATLVSDPDRADADVRAPAGRQAPANQGRRRYRVRNCRSSGPSPDSSRLAETYRTKPPGSRSRQWWSRPGSSTGPGCSGPCSGSSRRD